MIGILKNNFGEVFVVEKFKFEFRDLGLLVDSCILFYGFRIK